MFRIGINVGDVMVRDGDLFGDGVNVAARLEGLAEAGGVCVSASVFEQVKHKLSLGFEDMGPQEIKNIAEPVSTFRLVPGQVSVEATKTPSAATRWRVPALAAVVVAIITAGGLAWWQPWVTKVEPADPARMAYALPDRPSVAVLPFDNLSDDKEQEYFSDGVTEDIITDLSKISGLFVIARNSTFSYKGQQVTIRQIAEELGVRYVLQGSVRRNDENIRITAQLVEATTGAHLWAERYDRELMDVFAVQSDVARQVAKALAVTLKANENERLFQKYTASIDAYDVFLQARRTVDVPSKDNILRGEKLFRRVIELDPGFAGGYAGLAFNLSVQVRFQYSTSPDSDLAEAFDMAMKAIEVDRDFAWGHIALGGAYVAKGDADAAVNAVRQALALEPNGYEANLFIGFYLQFAGDAALAVEHLLLANRLSPVVTLRDLAFMLAARFMNRNYTEAVRLYTEQSRRFPRSRIPAQLVSSAAAYTLLDRPEEAAAVVKKLLEAHPDFNLSQFKYLDSWKSEENRTRLYNAAKKAGIPEFPNDG
jgi:adenylate cyclase